VSAAIFKRPSEVDLANGSFTSLPAPSMNFNVYLLEPLVSSSIVSVATYNKPRYSISSFG